MTFSNRKISSSLKPFGFLSTRRQMMTVQMDWVSAYPRGSDSSGILMGCELPKNFNARALRLRAHTQVKFAARIPGELESLEEGKLVEHETGNEIPFAIIHVE